MDNLAPLVIFVYKRPDITKQMFDAINKNLLAEQTDVFIFCDGSKNDSEREKVNAVRNVVHKFANSNNFRSVTVKESSSNKGLANSVISGVTEVINKYGKVIVLEDDLIAAHNFLQFMNDCLEFYENDLSVWSIGGMLAEAYKGLKHLNKYDKDIYACYRGGSCGWASWCDRWEKVDWEMSDYDSFITDRKRKKLFNRGGSNLVGMLRMQHDGKIDSWAVRWIYQQSKENMISIFPRKPLIKNIGFGADATHTSVGGKIFETEYYEDYEYKLEHVEIDKKLMRDYQWQLSRVNRTIMAYWAKMSNIFDKK